MKGEVVGKRVKGEESRKARRGLKEGREGSDYPGVY